MTRELLPRNTMTYADVLLAPWRFAGIVGWKIESL